MNGPTFENNLKTSLEKLHNLPLDNRAAEMAVPLYLHKNFLVKKIFVDRLKVAYSMATFKNKSVLDFGCGSGIFLEALSNEFSRGIGVDLDIEAAKQIISSKNIVLREIVHENEITDFSGIDIITAFDVLEHIKNLDSVLDNFVKTLAPNGIIIISGPTENFLYRFARKITRIGLSGDILGAELHVTNILEVKDRMVSRGLTIKKNVNLWNLFHVTSFLVSPSYNKK